MSSAPTVSAIVIFLNEARFLDEAIASIRAQTYPDWELLLVDDGSSDASTAIARRHAETEPRRIRYLEHPGHQNRGMSASRNLGIAHARGRYVGFLDADDVWLPEKLAAQVSLLDARPDVSMVYGRTLVWHSWQSGAASADQYCDLGVTPDTVIEPPRLLGNLIENRAQTPTTCNALVRRECLLELGGFQSEFRGMFEDQVFFMKLCLEKRVFVSSRTWARYRQRPDSCSALAERSGRVRADRERLLNWLAEHLAGQRVESPEIWQVLRREQDALRHPRRHKLKQALARIQDGLEHRLSVFRRSAGSPR
jgi:glycosyltransferase involved in cell wall biosynthesis